jgi:NADPH-dependent 2,4-dienoyl-CoA reductase/sulfur reductase-like enzyme/rhodanese-related sulfurtransferase
MSHGKRILIVGGVAGGASCAARARRLSEEAEIVIFDRGEFVSFANCGLPYYVGNVIKKEEHLLVATPELFQKNFNIQVRLQSEVLSIDRGNREIAVKDLRSGETYRERYDVLVLAPGATPIRPDMPGIDLPGIFSVRTIPDARRIKEWISGQPAETALIVGGGYIGMEMTENLLKLGLTVTIVEMLPQVMPLLDPEMVAPIHFELTKSGVRLLLNETVTGFEKNADGPLLAHLKSGGSQSADLVLLCIGVRPEVSLARDAGLELGELGGIRVNDAMRTSDEHIWAVGDAVEVKDLITGRWALVPLAGPANRQGRVAADAIMGRQAQFRGVQGTAVCGILGLTVALTGPGEKALKRLGLWGEPPRVEKIYLHQGHHAGYYPGAASMTLKLIFSKQDGRVMGAQAVGREGVEKRIDVISMAIQNKATVFDLEEAELCYAPQYGSAKDPVNMAGMIAANVLRGDAPMAQWEDLDGAEPFLLDVREPGEFKRGHLEGAVNIPLSELRRRKDELPRDRDIWAYCVVGQRSYYAARILSQYGYRIKSLSGGSRTHAQHKALQRSAPRNKPETR